MSKTMQERIWVCGMVVVVLAAAVGWVLVQGASIAVEPVLPTDKSSPSIEDTETRQDDLDNLDDETGCGNVLPETRDWRAEMREGPASELGAHAAEVDFARGLALVNRMEFEAGEICLSINESAFIEGFLSGWMDIDPVACYRWHGFAKRSDLRDYQRHALRRWAGLDPVGALAELAARGLLHACYERDVRVVIGEWVHEDPFGALDWVKNAGFDYDERAVESALWATIKNGRYADAVRLLEVHNLLAAFPKTAETIADAWAVDDSEAALAWMDTLSPKAKSHAAEGIIGRYWALPGGLDQAMALSELAWPDGHVPTPVASTITVALLKADPEQAIAWAEGHVSRENLPDVVGSLFGPWWLSGLRTTGYPGVTIPKLLTAISRLPAEERSEWIKGISRGTVGVDFTTLTLLLKAIPRVDRREFEHQLSLVIDPPDADLLAVIDGLETRSAKDMLIARNLKVLGATVEEQRALFDTLIDTDARAHALYVSDELLQNSDARALIDRFTDSMMRDALLVRHADLVKPTSGMSYLLALAESIEDPARAAGVASMGLRKLGASDADFKQAWILAHPERVHLGHFTDIGQRMSADELLDAASLLPDRYSTSLIEGWMGQQLPYQVHTFLQESHGEIHSLLAQGGIAAALARGEVKMAVDLVRGMPDMEASAWAALEASRRVTPTDKRMAFVATMDFSVVPADVISRYDFWKGEERLAEADAYLAKNPGLATPAVLALLYGGRAAISLQNAEKWMAHHGVVETPAILDLKLRAMADDAALHAEAVAVFSGLDDPSNDLVAAVAAGFSETADAVGWIDELAKQSAKDSAWRSIASRFPDDDAIVAALQIQNPGLRKEAMADLSYRVKQWGFEAESKLAKLPLSDGERRVLMQDWQPAKATTAGGLLDEW